MSEEGLTTKQKAGRGLLVLNTYCVHSEDGRLLIRSTEESQTVLADLLADLMHFANQNGLDFMNAVVTADEYFKAEVEEEAAVGRNR